MIFNDRKKRPFDQVFLFKKCSQKMNAFKIIFIVQHMRSWEPKIGKKKTSTGFVKKCPKNRRAAV